MFSGYWGREEESAGRFVTREGIRWYNTGDVVMERPETGFTYVGRRDRMVKRRGYRIELGEVESCLWRHPGVSEAAAIAVADPQAGTRIVGYLAARNGARPSIVEMKTFCNQHLPSYMNPDVFRFVDALPRTSTNKVDYQALIQSFQPVEHA